MELNKIYNQDCIYGMELLPDLSISICVSSPPYKDKDGYKEFLIEDAAYEIYRVLKNDSLCFINFGHLAKFKNRPFEVCNMFCRAGFNLLDTIIWIKNHFTPLRGNNLNNLYEFIFVFVKGNTPDLDRLSVGCPYKDKSNVGRYSNRDLRCSGNVWYIDIPTITNKSQRLHRDEYPLELPTNCIKLSNIPKDSIVLEPFTGSGTTCLAAKNLGMNYIGYEINPIYHKIAEERLK